MAEIASLKATCTFRHTHMCMSGAARDSTYTLKDLWCGLDGDSYPHLSVQVQMRKVKKVLILEAPSLGNC